jgi:hypothetical protein
MLAQVRDVHLPQRPMVDGRLLPVATITYPVTNCPFART